VRSAAARSASSCSASATGRRPIEFPDVEITMEQWQSVEDQESVLVDPICIGFDVSQARRTAIVAPVGTRTGSCMSR
jgi:hypothetical protein